LAYWPCPISRISMSMPSTVVCWVSSTTGVGLAGSILGQGISSKLTNLIVYAGSCSICCDYGGALRLLRDFLQASLISAILGGGMVVKMIFAKLVRSLTLDRSPSTSYTLSLSVISQFHNNPFLTCVQQHVTFSHHVLICICVQQQVVVSHHVLI
jgi:hypothetical protein